MNEMTDELLEKAERNIQSAKFWTAMGKTYVVNSETLEQMELIIAELRRLNEMTEEYGELLRTLIERTYEINRLKQERDELLTLLEKALIGAKHESCLRTSGLIDDPDPTWHCCDWTELVKEIEETLKKAKGAAEDA